MKFSTIFSAILATLAIGVSANPVPQPDALAELAVVEEQSHDIVKRAGKDEETDAYKAAKKAHSSLTVGKYYVFTMEWDVSKVDGDTASSEELKALQRQLGFYHVAVVSGVIKSTPLGKGTKNERKKLDFDAVFVDLIKKTGDKAALRGPVVFKKEGAGQKLKYKKGTTAKKGDRAAITKVGKAYFEDKTKEKYDVETNHCGIFKDYVLGKL